MIKRRIYYYLWPAVVFAAVVKHSFMWGIIVALFLTVAASLFGRRKRFAVSIGIILFIQGIMVLWARQEVALADSLSGESLTTEGRVLRVKVFEHSTCLYLTDTVTEMSVGSRRTGSVIVYGKDLVAEPFDRVRVSGQGTPFSTATNDGNYDERLHRHAHGTYLKLTDAVLLKRIPPTGLFRPMAAWDRYARQLFTRIGKKEVAALFSGLLTGRMDEDATAIQADFAATGIAHVLVISGFHLMFLAECLQRLAIKCRLHKSWAMFLCIVLLGNYVIFTGFGLSAQRAFCMYVLRAGAFWLRRSYDTLAALATVALMHLTARPAILYDRGFLLSFGFVLIVTTIHGWTKNQPFFRRLITFTFGVWFLSLPLLAYLFYEIPGYGMWMNLLAVPLTALLMLFMMAALAVGSVLPAVADYLLHAGAVILAWLHGATRINLNLPFAVLSTGAVSLWRVIMFYAVAFWWHKGLCGTIRRKRWMGWIHELPGKRGLSFLSRWKRISSRLSTIRWRWASRLLIPVMAVALLFTPHPTLPTIHILDVGQGDGIVIKSRTANVLIDGGSTDVQSVGTRRILPFMKYHRIRSFDYAFLSHVHKDHYSGLVDLMAAGRVQTLIITDYGVPTANFLSILATARKHGIPVYKIIQGDVFRLGDMKLECLHPPSGYRGGNPNSYSMVLRWTLGTLSVLFTGDLEAPEEALILKRQRPEPVQVLKVGHHGSLTSSTREWLDRLAPKAAIISCGRENIFGHPDGVVMERLNRAGIRTGRTDTAGQWSILPMRSGWRLRNFRGEQWSYYNKP